MREIAVVNSGGKMEWSQYVGEEGCARSFRPRYQRRGEIKKALAAIKVASNPVARVAKCDYKLLFTTRSRAIGRRKDDGSSGREADNMSREFELQKVARYGVNMADVLVLYKHRLPFPLQRNFSLPHSSSAVLWYRWQTLSHLW